MPADEYERKFMEGGAAVYSERHVSRIFTGLLGLGALVTLGAGFAVLLSPTAPAAAAIAPFLSSLVIAFVAVFWAVMRITVTADTLHVAYALLGVHIPLSAITHCKLDAQIGTGAKWGPGGWRYAPLGTTRGVTVEWSEGGSTKKCYIGSRDAEGLLKSIEAGRSTGVRVAEAPRATTGAAELEAAAEAVAEADTVGSDEPRAKA